MPFDFINSTITSGSALTTVGQALTTGSGVAQPAKTFTGITGTFQFANVLSGSFTGSSVSSSAKTIYIVNGLVVSASQ